MGEKNLKLPNLNHAQIAGYTTSEATLRYTTGGTAVANFTVAYNRRWQVNGEWKSEPSFIPCVAWKQAAERANEQIHKGTAVMVEGRLQSRSWDHHGETRTALELVVSRLQVLERREESSSAAEAASADSAAGSGDVPY